MGHRTCPARRPRARGATGAARGEGSIAIASVTHSSMRTRAETLATLERTRDGFIARVRPAGTSAVGHGGERTRVEARRRAMRWASDDSEWTATRSTRATNDDETLALVRQMVDDRESGSRDGYDLAYALLRERGERHARATAACAYWRLERRRGVASRFARFVEARGIEFVTLDVWRQMRDFVLACETLGEDGSWYAEDDAWPTLLDDFVANERARNPRAFSRATPSAEDERIDTGDDLARSGAGAALDATRAREVSFATFRESRKRRGSADPVLGLSEDFERELAMELCPPKRVCSEMDLDGL